MARTRLSPCQRFVVLDELHVDRSVMEALATWAEPRGLSVQDAIQAALCLFDARPAGHEVLEDRQVVARAGKM